MANRNRTAGHNWEREIILSLKLFNLAPYAVSSRSESANRDAEKVDVMNKDEYKNGRIPIDIQAKTTAGNLNLPKLFDELPRWGREVVFHNKTKKIGKQFRTIGKFVYMRMDLALTIWRCINILKASNKSLDMQLRIERMHNKCLKDELEKYKELNEKSHESNNKSNNE